MIGSVEINESPITNAIMEYVYGPHSLKRTMAPKADTKEPPFRKDPRLLVEKVVDQKMNDGADDPFGPLVFEEYTMGDSILDDLLDEEGGTFLT